MNSLYFVVCVCVFSNDCCIYRKHRETTQGNDAANQFDNSDVCMMIKFESWMKENNQLECSYKWIYFVQLS